MLLDLISFDSRVQHAARQLPFVSLFVSVSGAHLYGFPSPDSDVDLRACHLLPLAAFAGLEAPLETLEIARVEDGLDWDIVSLDAQVPAASSGATDIEQSTESVLIVRCR